MLIILCIAIGVLWALRAQWRGAALEPVPTGDSSTPRTEAPAPAASIDLEEGRNFGGGAAADPAVPAEPLVRARSQLTAATRLVVLGGIGKLLFAPLLWCVTGVVLAQARFLFYEAWHSITVERKPRIVVVDAITMVCSLVSGWFFINVTLYWFYRLFNYIALRTEDHSRSKLIDVYARQPRVVWGLVGGVETELAFESLQAGDLIVLRAGDLVPVDGEIVEGSASVDQHILTGESQLAEKAPGDAIFASTIVVSGRLVVRSRETGAATMAAQVGAALNATNSYAATVEARGMALADKATIPSLLVGAAALAVQGPGAGLAALAADFGSGMRVLGPVAVLKHLQSGAQSGLYIKDGRSLELLRSVDTIVFDKTGTLTLPQPLLMRTHGWGEDPARVLALAAAAEMRLTHPIARAIVAAAQDAGLAIPAADQNSYDIGFGVRVDLPDGVVRVGSLRYLEAEHITADAEARSAEEAAHAIGHSFVFVALDERLIGAVELQPQLKPGAESTIRQLKAMGLGVVILSGDHAVPTRALAERLGVDRHFAGVLPQGKAEIVRGLQAEGHSVCFVGDGINDSIALKAAQVSVSFHGASTIATDAAQVVMIEESLETLLLLFELSRSLDANMQLSYRISMVSTGAVIGATILFGAGLAGAVVVANIARVTGLINAMRMPDTHREGVASPTPDSAAEPAHAPSPRALSAPAAAVPGLS